MQAAAEESPAIDAHVASLMPEEVEGGWKLLCTNVLARAAVAIRSCVRTSKESVRQMHAARRWLFSDEGLITFTDACHAVGVDPGKARDLIVAGGDDGTIKRLVMPALIFGKRNSHATGSDEDQTAA